MQRDAYLVVISVLEGHNFPFRPKHQLVIECKFDDELLATDPVDHVETPQFTTELAWEIDRKALHQHKMQRTPLKLQCYAVDTVTMIRENIGYILLDLRGAQQNTHTAKWYNLLSSKYSRLKPAVKIAMILEDDATPSQSLFKANDAPPRSIQIPTQKIEVSLNEDDGYFQLGPNKTSCELFVLAVTIGSAFNLEQLISGDELLPSVISGFFFYYSIFGTNITNDSFDNLLSPNLIPERASMKIRSTVDSINAYFMQNPEFKIHLCCGEHVLGTATIHFLSLVNKKNLSLISKEPIAVDGSYTLRAPGKAIELKAAKPHVNVTLTLRKAASGQDSANIFPPFQLPEQVASPNTALNKPLAHDINHNPFPVANQVVKTHSKSNNEKPIVKSARDDTKEPCSTEDGPHSSSSRSSSYPKSTSSSVPVDEVETELQLDIGNKNSTLTLNKNSMLTARVSHANISSIQHFRFILDILSVSNLQLSFPANICIKYCYPFFGYCSSVITNPIEVNSFSEARILSSKCGFEFACTYQSLAETFKRHPISLEMWHIEKGVDDVLLGNAQLVLTKLLETVKTKFIFSENMEEKIGFRQTCHGIIPVFSCADQTKIAQLNVVTILEDNGAVADKNIICLPQEDKIKSHHVKKKPHQTSKVPLKKSRQRDTKEANEQYTAINLELWISQEKETFIQKLKGIEIEHLKLLGSEFAKRDKEREVLVTKQVSEYQALEKQLSQAINGLETRERQVSAAEEKVSRLREDTMREKERTVDEVEEATRRIKEDCVHQVRLEKEKKSLLQEHNKRLTKQVNDMEQKCATLMEQFYDFKNAQNSRPEVRLQEEINLTRLEKVEAERKLESINKSKLHYKQQWGRTLKELAMMRKRHQDQALANVKQQRQEMEAIKLHCLANDERTAIAEDQDVLKHIQNDIEIIKQRKCINQIDPVVITSCGEEPPSNQAINKRVSRLIQERATLLRTGVYSRNDRIIAELDRQIDDEMKQQIID